ncbi:MAG TPA: ATP-binding protein [Acidimicrobiales bacterium]|nr:ATP-binding protein [Acidimicrobiales bacterium]
MSALGGPGGASPLPARPRYRGALTFTLVISALTWLVFAALEVAGYQETADMASLDDIVDTSTAVVAVVVAALCMMHWRLADELTDLFVGFGLVALGVLTIGFDDLAVPRLADDLQRSHAVTLVAPVGFVLAVALLTAPLVLHRLQVRRTLAAVAGLVVLAAVASSAYPGVAHVLAGRRDRAVPSGAEAAAHVVLAAVLLPLAVAYWRDGRARHRTLHAWLGLMVFGIVQSRVAFALTFPAGTLWLAASRILRMESLLFVLMGVNRELQEGFARQQYEVRRSTATVERLEAQRAAEQQALEESRHDVRSALFAIGGVADLLNRAHDDLDAGTMEALTQALGAEVGRLQQLVAEQEREEPAPFSLLEAISPVLLMERSNGLDVTCMVDERLTVVGRPKETAQVLRSLLDNARAYAPGSPVTIRSERRDDWAVLLVDDCGPGVPAAERKAIFERARRGSTADGAPGSGLGLYVAARLMREQGGDIWVTDRSGGGASFVLSFPLHSDGPWPPPPRGRKSSA